MTLALSNVTQVRTGSVNRLVQINNGVAGLFVLNSAGLYGYVVNTSPWDVGNENILISDVNAGNEWNVGRVDNNELFLIAARTGLSFTDHHIVTRSGDTLSLGTAYNAFGDGYLSFSMAVNSTIAFADVPINNVAFGNYRRFDVTTSPPTQTDNIDATLEASTRRPLGVAFLDSNDLLVAFYHGTNKDIYFQVLDLTSGISAGTENNSGIDFASSASFENYLSNCLAPLTSTKAVALLPREAATDTLSLWTINRTASAISSYGTPVDLGIDISGGTIISLSSSEILAAWESGTNEISLARYSVSGDAFTLEDSGTIDRGTPVSNIRGLVLIGSNALISWVEDGNVFVAQIGLSTNYGLTHSSGGIPGDILVVS